MSRDELRQRYHEAIRNSGPLSVTNVLYAVMAVRDEELNGLRYELEQWHAAYGESALPATLARLKRAEDAVARVQKLADFWTEETHPTHDHLCPDDLRRQLLAALDREEPSP